MSKFGLTQWEHDEIANTPETTMPIQGNNMNGDQLARRIDQVLVLLRDELFKAMTKHRPMANGHEGYAVILEELDELWDHVKADTWATSDARKEAIQVAAMGLRYALDVTGL